METPLWERSKENAAPLERGRSVSALERSFHMESSDEKKRMLEHYERLVQPSEQQTAASGSSTLVEAASPNDDPLIHWLSYIKFHQDAYPSDTHAQFLLLERCMRALAPISKYADDPRFVRVCCTYADKTSSPGEVFQHLYRLKIGHQTATFWVAWAFVAEKQKDYVFASKVFEKGLRKKAQPLSYLKRRKKQYERRMSRLWLHSSSRQEEDDEDDETGRGALGELSEEAFRRNDRSRSSLPASQRLNTSSSIHTFRDRREMAAERERQRPRSNVPGPVGEFAIFQDGGDENGNNLLDDSLIDYTDRQIAREIDRRKENTLSAEPWNERGSLSNTAQYRYPTAAASAPARPAPAFCIHVDEECSAQHKREEEERYSRTEQHRMVRDERTLREREDEGVAEKLAKDPLRYVRHPSMLEADQEAERAHEHHHAVAEALPVKPKAPKKKSASGVVPGFNKRLLEGADGSESCFEEARAAARYYKLTPGTSNVNLFCAAMPNQRGDSSMSMDESMEDLSKEMDRSTASRPPVHMQDYNRKPPAVGTKRSLFRSDNSLDAPTPRNASTASSTVDEAVAVGVPLRRDEQTINTQLALKELSIMFASPALALNDSAQPVNRSGGLGPILNESGTSLVRADGDTDTGDNNADGEAATFGGSIADLVGDATDVNSSFAPAGNRENRGLHNPTARTNATPGFDSMALKTIKDEEQGRTGCSASQRRVVGPVAQTDPFRTLEETELDADPGFQVYEDAGARQSQQRVGSSVRAATHREDAGGDRRQGPSAGSGFEIFQDTGDETMQRNANAQISSSAFQIHQEPDPREGRNATDDDGDTATLSEIGDVMDVLTEIERDDNDEIGSVDSVTIDLDGNGASDVKPVLERHRADSDFSSAIAFGDISRIVPADDTTRTVAMVSKLAVDYEKLHASDVQSAILRVKSRSSMPILPKKLSLARILSTKGLICDLPTHVMPKKLRQKKSTAGAKVNIGQSSTIVKQELGRGVYGIVSLLEVDRPGSVDTIACKAQCPADCLAWEYEILEKVHDRVGPDLSPSALSFMSLADGALLAMSAGSKSGLNLVDLVNVYIKQGEKVPEIIVLHYTARMLHHLEMLHGRGKILHCDTKPDNWVLTSSINVSDERIEASELMLVDFGRAIDLTTAQEGIDPMETNLVGLAAPDDMMCVAMRERLPWSFDIDTFGVCASAYVLLYGSHIEIELNDKKRWMPRRAPFRYFQVDLWNAVFDSLLNIDEVTGIATGSRPHSLRQLRKRIEDYLQGESSRLATALRHQETFLPGKRPRET